MNKKILAIILVLLSIIGTQSVVIFWLYSHGILLQHEHEGMASDYGILQSKYNGSVSNYDSLSSTYDYLQEDYDQLLEIYDDLMQTHNSYVDAYEEVQELVNLRSSHPTEQEKTLITPNDPDVQNLVVSVTGGWSNTSDWNEYWDDCMKLYDWVFSNVEYRSDGLYPILPSDPSGNVQQYGEMWQLPNETLSSEEGDCEDMAMLLASLL